MAYNWSRVPGVWNVAISNVGTLTTFDLDSAFVHGTSGDAWLCRFISPVSQTDAALNLYVWVNAVTGSPTDVRLGVYRGAQAGQDPQRPETAGGSSPLAESAATDLSAMAGHWATFTIASVSLTRGFTYFLILDNRTTTPASHFPAIAVRGKWNGASGAEGCGFEMVGSSTNGITTDPTLLVYPGPAVIAFGDGTLLGNPYVGDVTHASNANDRGIRYRFAEDVLVSGFALNGVSAAAATAELNATVGGANVATQALDLSAANGVAMASRWTPTTLTAGISYDAVMTFSGNTSSGGIINMGEAAPPTDVQACRPQGALGYVDGATPGSYTFDPLSLMLGVLVVDDVPVSPDYPEAQMVGV